LKSLKSFSLYKYNISRGTHLRIIISDEEQSVLSYFLVAFEPSRRYPNIDVARSWPVWVPKEMNANNAILFEGIFSLELTTAGLQYDSPLQWSRLRFFSLPMGLGNLIKLEI